MLAPVVRASTMVRIGSLLVLSFAFLTASGVAADGPIRSHPPIRPLPVPSDRPHTPGAVSALFVDPAAGDDAGPGSKAQPWKTLARAVRDLKAGGVLYLRGGVYYEHVAIAASGAVGKPITIRSFPDELAILDGGLREFAESPATAWEPCPGGAPGEYRSAKAYPTLANRADSTNVLGHFADAMIPLQGYRFLTDLRSDNVYWNVGNKVGDEGHIYCGPGAFHDPTTGRIHVRLAHTRMKYLPAADNYAGETDPRKLPLVIAGNLTESPLSLTGARFVTVQDVVVRGARGPAINVRGCENIQFDGLTIYGGSSCVRIEESGGVRLVNTACRGIAAPWTFRGSLKYRAIESRLVSASGWTPTPVPNRDLEFAYCEFTDSVDGVFVGGAKGVRFHHNFLDNVTDDGVFLTSGTAYDGATLGGDVRIWQNLFARCLTTFAFGVGHGRQKVLPNGVQTGSGAMIYRNVFDFRAPIRYFQPRGPDDPPELPSRGRFASDHGSPAWEPMTIYHNTLLCDDARGGHYGAGGFASAMGKGARRRAFNNVAVQMTQPPQVVLPPTNTDFQADGNLLWSVKPGPAGEPFAKFRASPAFAESKAKYSPGWGTNDRFADPKFAAFSVEWERPIDLRPTAASPAIDSGVSLPAEWPDPLRAADRGTPDIGALPLGSEPWAVGVRGRLTAFGAERKVSGWPDLAPMTATEPFPLPKWTGQPAALMVGYPAPVAPLIEFAVRRQGVPAQAFEKQWLDTKEYANFGAVFVIGNLTRGKVQPDTFSADDLKRVDAYLKGGGTVVLVLAGKGVFQTAHGRAYLDSLTGATPAKKGAVPEFKLADPAHPWVKHLDPTGTYPWQRPKYPPELVLRTGRGERIVASDDGAALLYRVRVGKGQLIYLGWDIHDALPYTRDKASTPAAEKAFEDQMRVLFAIAGDLFPTEPTPR